MPTQLASLRKRGTDSVIEVRCDRRSLCTIAQYYSQYQPITSLSQIVRIALEALENAILEDNGELEVLSMEEAEEILANITGKSNLNRRGMQKLKLKQQLEKESAILEGRPVGGMHERRITKHLQQSGSKDMSAYLEGLTKDDLIKMIEEQEGGKDYQPRMPEDVVESSDEAVRRRNGELEEMKKGFIPADQGSAGESSEGEEGD